MRQDCKVRGCKSPHTAKGLCRLHYDRWHRHGNTDVSRPRRFWKYPPELVAQFEQLIRDTEYTVQRCCEIVGLHPSETLFAIVHKHRRYITNGRWVDRNTGQVKPEMCTYACAAEKIGLSKKTIQRRIRAGEISPAVAVSHKSIPVFSAADIDTLRKIGRKKAPGRRVLTAEEVADIRNLADAGVSVSEIAALCPLVSRKQIRRIVQRKQWK